MEPTTTIIVSYRSTGYTKDDIDDIKNSLAPIGSVRVRPIGMPAAEGTADLWILVSFIGATFFSGFLQQAGANLFSSLSTSIKNIINRKKKRDWQAEFHILRFSYDDIDIVISNPSLTLLANINDLIKSIYYHGSGKVASY